GTFVAILGPNGSGKTSLLRAILGLVEPSAGRIDVLGHAPHRGDPGIGYVPQHSSFDPELPFRGRDLVRLGIDGHRWGVSWRDPAGGTVLFVTHDVNPVLRVVDQVLFVVNGRWAAGTPDEVLRSDRMSELYGSHVDVIRVHGRILVVGESTESGFNIEEPHH